jgi:hypothetical protein
VAIAFSAVKKQMLPLAQVRSDLAATEPLEQEAFPLSGGSKNVAKFKLEPDWNQDLGEVEGMDPVGAFVKIGSQEYQLTKDAILEAGSLIGLPKVYLSRTPANLMQPHLNYWFSNKDRELKILSSDGRGLAFTKASINPFSNLRLVDQAIEGIEKKYGKGEVWVDFKYMHTLRHTAVRLVIPAEEHGVKEDTWCTGIQIKNSLVGESPLQLQGYLFCYECTNGATSVHADSGAWNRRRGGQDEDEVMSWARTAVDDILGHLDHDFDAVEQLASVDVPEESVNRTMDDLFRTYKVPLKARESVIKQMVEQDDLTMYGVMQAVTSAANPEGTPESMRASLLEIGGSLPAATAKRCPKCSRIQPE